MGRFGTVPRPLAEVVCEHLQRTAPALMHNLSEDRLAEWDADPEIRGYLASITCLDLSTTPTSLQQGCNNQNDLVAYNEQNHLGVLLECTPGLTTLDCGYNTTSSGEGGIPWRYDSANVGLFDAIGRLTHLQSLIFRGGPWSSATSDALCNLTQLVELDLSNTPWLSQQALAIVLQPLSGLTKLKISDCSKFINREESKLVCEALGRMTALRCLGIKHMFRDFFQVPPETLLAGALCGLTQLTELDLAENIFCAKGATEMASVLQQLTQLQELKMGLVKHVRNFDVEAVPALTAPLHHLPGLTSLATYEGICSPETFRSLAVAIGRMSALTFLDVGGYATSCGSAGAKALADELQSLTCLTTLKMKGNYIDSEGATHLARALLNLTGLTELDLGENDLLFFHGNAPLGLEVLAPSIAKMPNLTSLNIDTFMHNETLSNVSRTITAVTEMLHQKTNLQSLVLPDITCDLRRETLDAAKDVYGPLGEVLLGMDSLRKLFCDIEPFSLVFKDLLPDEVTRGVRGKRSKLEVLEYVRELRRQGTVPCSMLRLLVIGMGEAGKTCLQRALFNEKGLTVAIALDDRTVAIDTHLSWKPAGEAVDFTVWDFAGQPGYQTAHSPFLSERCLSMLVFRADHGVSADVIFCDKIKPWLDLLHAHSPGGHVLLVCTHWESPSEGGEQAILAYQQRVCEVLKKVSRLSLSRVDELNRATKKEATNVRTKLSNLERELKGAREALENIPRVPSQESGHGTRARESWEKKCDSLEQEVQAARERCTKLSTRNSEDAKQMQILLANNDMNGTSADGVHLVECIRGDGSSVRSLRDVIATSAQALPFMGEAIPAGWMQLKDEVQALSESEFQSSILVACDTLCKRLYNSPKVKAWLGWRPFSDAKRFILKGLHFWQDLGFVKITSNEQYVVVHPPRLIDLLRPLIQHVPFKDLVESAKADTVVKDFYKLDSDMQIKIKNKLIYGLEKKFMLDAWLLDKLKFWSDIDVDARTQALQILSDFNLVVDRRVGGNLLQDAGKRQYLCVCRILCNDAAPGSVAGVPHSMEEVKITVTYKVSPICPPGLFPQFLAQQIVARHHLSEMQTLPRISRAGLYMQITNLVGNNQKMLVKLLPNDSSIVFQCSSLGLLRDACCTVEETVSSLFPGLSLSVKVLFPYTNGDQFVWDIDGNMVGNHSFGQVLAEKRWDSNMYCIESVTGAHFSVENVKLRSILEPTLGLTASFFLSHCWRDKSESSGFAKGLVCMLEEVSRELVWYDSEQLSNVNHFPSKMQQGVDRAQCIIIFLSRVYLSRQNCLLELMWAWKQHKLNGKQLIILPVDSALTLGALAEWAKDGRNLEVDDPGAGGPFVIHHLTLEFVSKRLTGFRFRTEWQDDCATDGQRWKAVMDFAKERPVSLEHADRKIARMECTTEDGTWLLADLGEEGLPEDFYSAGTMEAIRSSVDAEDSYKDKQSPSGKDDAAFADGAQAHRGTAKAHGEFQDSMEMLDPSLRDCMTAKGMSAALIVKLCQDLGSVKCLQDLADLEPEDLDTEDFKDIAPRFKRLVKSWIKEQQQLQEQPLQLVVTAMTPIYAAARTDAGSRSQVFAGGAASLRLDAATTELFAGAQLGAVCEKVCAHFGISRVSDIALLEDSDIAKLELKLVDSRHLEALVRKVRDDGEQVGAKGKASVPHAELQGEMDPAIPRFALTIGNNKYTHFGELASCLNDARAMQTELAKLNFTVTMLLDSGKTDTDTALNMFISSLPDSSPSVVLINFSGHGLKIDGENFLVPVDADEAGSNDEIKKKCISVQHILSTISSKFGGSILVILLLDCCREKTLLSTKFKGCFAKLNLASHLTRIFVAHATAPGKLAAAFHPKCQNLSPFTCALVECLKTRTIATQDIEAGFMSAVCSLMDDLTDGQQRPFHDSNLRESFVFQHP
eukprot:CAMPEP_0173123836 /NCGR_PEP_ID=MMETSP1102-20130122/55260_1 /TAXON_ID=49646 /ORGANISM="Geminigera sp., Strain Caron Lab Isolate" /LENGTH=1918 /DNA_ID=CAMNT_0014031993 /DNA_START=646 /DNA_END=6402 /DNA_ORIENTATION=-